MTSSKPQLHTCICIAFIATILVLNAAAQATATAQLLGGNSAAPNPTAPAGGIILYGNATSSFTGQPVRHLWVADAGLGICRVDPDIDAGMAQINANPGGPSPFAINTGQCPFSINSLPIAGGPMTFDPVNNFLYFADAQNSSQGIFRIGYLPSADNGNGSLDLSTLYGMGGNAAGSSFSGGQSGCALPADSTVAGNPAAGRPSGAALGPDGNLWVSFRNTGAILRFNSPATAGTVSFGSCADFIQLVASTPTHGGNAGLAWIGHDMWGSENSPFVIANADRTCQALITPSSTATAPACTAATQSSLASIAAVSLSGDQFYPNLNGNNLYIGSATDDIWIGNVAGNASIVNPFEPALAFGTDPNSGGPATININAAVADMTDGANIALFSGDDPSGTAAAGAGQWWRVAQNPAPAGIPGIPTIVRAVAGSAQATVSWSAAQVAQPVTSYTVHTSFTSDGSVVPDVIVNPPAGGTFPPTSTTISGLSNGVSYAFEVSAGNASGSSALSAQSNTVSLPGIPAPGIPINISATPGDAAAFISWAAPPNSGTQNISNYTITATPGGLAATVGGTATSGIIIGLSNGGNYTFTVHASNAGGNGMESTPSNSITPGAKPVVSVSISGPSFVTSTPAHASFTVSIRNTSVFPVSSAATALSVTQASPDGGAILSAAPSSGTCGTGSAVTVALNCSLGTLAGGQTVTIAVTVNIQASSLTLNANFSSVDSNNSPVNGSAAANLVGGGGSPTPAIQVSVSASSQSPTLKPLQSTNHVFSATNQQSTLANNLVYTIKEPAQLTINSITVSSTAQSTDPASCGQPQLVNGLNIINCSISALGGNTSGGAKITTAQTINITVRITAPNMTPLDVNPSGGITFTGSDTQPSSVTFLQRVR